MQLLRDVQHRRSFEGSVLGKTLSWCKHSPLEDAQYMPQQGQEWNYAYRTRDRGTVYMASERSATPPFLERAGSVCSVLGEQCT